MSSFASFAVRVVSGLTTMLALSASLSCRNGSNLTPVMPPYVATPVQTAFLDTVQRRTFDWFWETTNPRNGLVPDRWPTQSFSSVAAVGFGLTAYAVGVERSWITRE